MSLQNLTNGIGKPCIGIDVVWIGSLSLERVSLEKDQTLMDLVSACGCNARHAKIPAGSKIIQRDSSLLVFY